MKSFIRNLRWLFTRRATPISQMDGSKWQCAFIISTLIRSYLVQFLPFERDRWLWFGRHMKLRDMDSMIDNGLVLFGLRRRAKKKAVETMTWSRLVRKIKEALRKRRRRASGDPTVYELPGAFDPNQPIFEPLSPGDDIEDPIWTNAVGKLVEVPENRPWIEGVESPDNFEYGEPPLGEETLQRLQKRETEFWSKLEGTTDVRKPTTTD